MFIFVDGASLNVLLLLSVVCSVTLMKQRHHCDGCNVVRQVHRKIQGKTVKPVVSTNLFYLYNGSSITAERTLNLRTSGLVYGLFTLPDLDSDSDSKPNGYIAPCRSFHTAQGQVQILIPTANYRNGIRIRVCT